MLKKRFGDDFVSTISSNLEIKAHEVVRRDNRGGRGQRRPRGDRTDKGDRRPREKREKKEGEKAEEETTQQQPAATTTEGDKSAPAKREGRRRGAREGQQ